MQYYSRKVKIFTAMYDDDQPGVHPLTYFRIAQLQSSALLPSLRHLHYNLGEPSIPHIFLFLSPLIDSVELFNIDGFEDTVVGSFLATLPSECPMLSRMVLRAGDLSADVLKRSIVHFNQLRTLELFDAVYMDNFALWETLGTLPSLVNFTLRTLDPHPMPAFKSSSSTGQSGDPKYFDTLESLFVTASFVFIQRLLSFIDSSCLKSIKVHPDIDYLHKEHDHTIHEDLFAPSMTIIASKWSKSLQNLFINTNLSGITRRNVISKYLMPLTDLHETQTFHLKCRWVENMDDDIRRLVTLWPKIRFLNLKQTLMSLSTLRTIAEKCPELRYLHIQLDISSSTTIPPLDSFSKTVHHNLEVLTVAGVHPSASDTNRSARETTRFAKNNTRSARDTTSSISTQTTRECRIQVARCLDLIFPHLKSIEVWDESCLWSVEVRDLVKLCQDSR